MKKRNMESGETLIESLTAILVFTFASILMLTMVSAGNDINQRLREADGAENTRQFAAEMAEGEKSRGIVKLQIGDEAERVTVEVFGSTETAYGFFRAEGTQ